MQRPAVSNHPPRQRVHRQSDHVDRQGIRMVWVKAVFFLDVFSLHGNISWHRFITVQEQVGPCVFMCKFLSACFRVFGTVAAQGILGYYR